MKKKRFMIVLTALCLGVATLVLTAPGEAVSSAPPSCDCEQRTTATFTRVGATCAKAQQRAIDASSAAAVCNPGETPCGSTTYWVSNCTTNHVGQLQASSFTTYACEVCFF